MERLRCDKPYDVDEARARKGLPRRKRKNPRSTCYELAIRIPEEYQSVLGRKKVTRTVYALNKREDLKGQVRDFEDEQNAKLEALLCQTKVRSPSPAQITGATPLGTYLERYIELRSFGSISKQALANEKHFAMYVESTIGDVALRLLTPEDVERCVLAVPRISRERALERRAAQEENRKRLRREGSHRAKKPYGPLRVAGPDMQHKVLKFLREALNDAVEREIIDRNVAKARFLSKNFRKGRPLIDPLSEEEAARFLSELRTLPLCSFKVEALLLFSSGMRPEEMLGVRPNGLRLRGTPSARITGAVRRESGEVEEYTKSSSSRRTVPLDRYTADAVEEWLELKSETLREMGIKSIDGLPVVAELDKVKTYSSFKNEWDRFVGRTGFGDTRPYSLRHTFATLNLAHGENIRAISAILGHASPSYTLDLYVGYMPSLSAELSNRYVDRLSGVPDGK